MFNGIEWHRQHAANHYASLAMSTGWAEYVKAELERLEAVMHFEGVTELARAEYQKLTKAKK